MNERALHPESDQELIARIRGGDKGAFRILFDQHYRVLLGTAINILRDEAKGKDVVQEVLLQIWKNREKLEIRSSLAAYLKRAVINRSINQVRAAKPFVDESTLENEEANTTDALEQLEVQDLEEALKAALDTLPERCRMVFVMKRLEGMSQKEIAAELNISTKTVENQITKAMKVMHIALSSFRKKNSDST